MNPDLALKTTKAVVGFVVGSSVSKVVVTNLKQNTTMTTPVHNAELIIGAWALGALVADRTETYAATKIDELATAWKKFKAEKAKKETQS